MTTTLESTLTVDDDRFRERADHWRERLEAIREEEAVLRLGGGEKAQAKQRGRGKKTARERVEALCDPGSDFLELGLWAAWDMYEEYGGGTRSWWPTTPR